MTAGQVSVTPVPRGRAGLQGVPPRGPWHHDRVGKGPLREPEVPRRCGVRCSEATATSDGEEEDGVGTVQETAGEARDGPPEGPARPGTGTGGVLARTAGMKTPPPAAEGGRAPACACGEPGRQAARPQGRNGARNGTFATIRTRRSGGNAPNLCAPDNTGSKRRKQTSWRKGKTHTHRYEGDCNRAFSEQQDPQTGLSGGSGSGRWHPGPGPGASAGPQRVPHGVPPAEASLQAMKSWRPAAVH